MKDQEYSGPYTEEEVITMLKHRGGVSIGAYDMYEFYCIDEYYELSSGYYCHPIAADPICVYCLHYCCLHFGSFEDKKKFNENVIYSKHLSKKYHIPIGRDKGKVM